MPGASDDLEARVYRPQGEGPFPTVVFFHGGGWVIGDLDTHDNMARHACRGSGAVVVAWASWATAVLARTTPVGPPPRRRALGAPG